jgi:hypothetical protein
MSGPSPSIMRRDPYGETEEKSPAASWLAVGRRVHTFRSRAPVPTWASLKNSIS